MGRNKTKVLLVIAILAIITLVVLATRVISFSTSPVFVAKVFDGDSILLSDNREIRYIGIDAPETGGKRPREYGGEEAKHLNERHVLGKEVELQYDVEKKDTYGRTLAYVRVNGMFVNKELVSEGVAIALPYPPNLLYHEELKEAMGEARRMGRGLWAEQDQWIIGYLDADRYIGESKTVLGRTLHTDVTKAGIFLNYGADFRTDFTVFIPRKDFGYFDKAGIMDPAAYYDGKLIEVTGTIKEYNGASIMVRHPDQIHIRE
jgi:micrococcal nuclease